MRIFVTGASGFVGDAVCSVAVDRGHDVIGLVRAEPAAARLTTALGPAFTPALGDLRRPDDWIGSLDGVDAVVHLAATKGGGFYEQFPGTVVGTERLLAALAERGVPRLVHVSSLAVYDYRFHPRGARFDESTPLERVPRRRDGYAQTKLYQEQLVQAAADAGLATTIVRPGAVWGAGNLWDAGLGQVAGPLWLAAGDGVVAKFTYVENCAEAIVLAAERDEAVGDAVNVIDDDVPTQRRYAAALQAAGVDIPAGLPLPYPVLAGAVRFVGRAGERTLGPRLKLPSMLTTTSVEARFKPFTYDNRRAKELLGWTPRFAFDEALARALERESVAA